MTERYVLYKRIGNNIIPVKLHDLEEKELQDIAKKLITKTIVRRNK
jgi:hypothetical protein